MRAWLALAASAVTAAVAFGVNAQVLRVVPHSNLNILDPIWTTQYMARNHGYMVYTRSSAPTRRAGFSRRWSTNGP